MRTIDRLSPTAALTRLAGSGSSAAFGDGPATGCPVGPGFGRASAWLRQATGRRPRSRPLAFAFSPRSAGSPPTT